MYSPSYVTYAQVEACAIQHYSRYGTKTGFRDIIRYLFDHHQFHEGSPALPAGVSWSVLPDAVFYQLLNELPVKNVLADEPEIITENQKDPSIAAESIMPEHLEVFALKYVPYIIEKMHVHNFFEVNYVMDGTCRMIFENEIRELSQGEFCIIAPCSRHDVTIEDDSIVLSIMLRKNTFETTFFKLLAQEDLLSAFFRSILYSRTSSANYMLFSTGDSHDISNIIKDVFMECYIQDSYSNTCVISRIHLLFSQLLRRYSNTIQFYSHQQNDGEHASFIQVLQYIQNHYQTTNLEELSRMFHYNSSYLSRLIKKNTGQTFLDILTGLRMSKAQDLLLHTNLKIEEITAHTGYQSADHFSRLFKKIYGAAPREYRQSSAASQNGSHTPQR